MKRKSLLILMMTLLYILVGCCNNATPTSHPADVLQHPEQQDIYFATGNDHYDLYVGYSWVPGPEITLLSREYIDPASITVTADIQAEYSVYVTEQTAGAALTTYEITEHDGVREVTEIAFGENDFPLYLYQTYAGLDWTEAGNRYREYSSALEQGNDDDINAAYASYSNAVTEFAQEYTQLRVEDLPVFYEYLIQVTIDHAETTETLSILKITVGDKVYDMYVGEILIHPNPGYGPGSEYLSMAMSSPYWLMCYPYGEGIEQCQSEIWCAEEPLTITGLSYLENTMATVEVLEITVLLSDNVDAASAGTGIEIKWDGTTPIYVEQGKFVSMKLKVQDERLKDIHYHSKLYPVVKFEVDGTPYEIISEIPLYRHYTDHWLLYAIGLDGLDMESYFNGYYYVAARK